MGLEGCGKFLKIATIIANVLIFIAGISVLGVGIWMAADNTPIVVIVGNDFYLIAAYIMIATGTFIAAMAFLGFVGAWMEKKCLLITYFIIGLLIFIVLLVAGILGYVYSGGITKRVRRQMYDNIVKNFNKDPTLKIVYDKLQTKLKCCGLVEMDKGENMNNEEAHKVWEKNTEFTSSNKIPISCCNMDLEKEFGNVNYCQSNPAMYSHKKDCVNSIKQVALIVGGVDVGVAFVLLLGMIFALILSMRIE